MCVSYQVAGGLYGNIMIVVVIVVGVFPVQGVSSLAGRSLGEQFVRRRQAVGQLSNMVSPSMAHGIVTTAK